MRLYCYFILLFVEVVGYSQDSNNRLNILSYKHGCHGNCIFTYDDSCGLNKDSIIETINVYKIKNKYYLNGRLVDSQKIDSLNKLIKAKLDIIKKLNSDLLIYSHAKFVPPSPKCFEFEEYKFYTNDKVLFYKLLNKDSSELGYILRDEEILFFKIINGFIRQL